jgi:hypothetical protein
MPAAPTTDEFHISQTYQPLARRAGLDARGLFSHPDIRCWRKLPDRENCTLDLTAEDGSSVRWHIKRFPTANGVIPALVEVKAHQLVVAEDVPTAPLIGWGQLSDRRSFLIFEDLQGYLPADRLLETGYPFDSLLIPTADLAARLHTRGLHHRDLYLCHFMVRPADTDDAPADVRIIDTARVRPLPGMFTRARWIVKDLAQFFYSTRRHNITDAQRLAWLERYAQQRGLPSAVNLRSRVERKAARIANHDREIHRTRPDRNISIPTG